MAKVTREKFKVYNGVFDDFTLDTIENLKRRRYIDVLRGAIKTGKEGDVYLAEKDNEKRAVKMFRMTSANFKKISQYINRDFRFKNVKGSLRKVILVWAEKEFRNLLVAHRANVNVPFPFKQMNNVIIMEYIDGGMLKDIPLENPKDFFEKLVEQMYLFKNEARMIHGDLSEFNIMVQNQEPYIIDVGQSMIMRTEEDFKSFYDLYERDVRNVVRYFNKVYSLNLEMEDIFRRLEKVEDL